MNLHVEKRIYNGEAAAEERTTVKSELFFPFASNHHILLHFVLKTMCSFRGSIYIVRIIKKLHIILVTSGDE